MKLFRQPLLPLLLLLLYWTPLQAQQENSPLVLASLAPVYQLAQPLLRDTGIELQLLPDSPRSMASHQALFVRRAERFEQQFAQADAVLTVGRLWDEDPLYISARQANIRVVNIDASKPYSHELDGVAVATAPVSGGVSPWFWLSPSNAIRSIDIIGRDLQTLYPAQAERIKSNMDLEKAEWLALKAEAESRLLDVDPLVYALAEEFVYLSSDLGIFVDGYFIKQDIDWTEADYARLTAALQAHQVRVVIHKWEPAEPIRQAIEAAGATLVVLDTLETSDDLLGGMRRNIDLLVGALPAF